MVAAVAEAHRRDWTQVLATTVLLTHDLDLAEECTQDAYEQALRAWPDHGIPDRPGAWLTTTARNRARDVLRRESAFRRAMPLLVPDQTEPGPESGFGDDGRLRLIFTCCHPALSGDAQIALTLRLVCGLSTAEVARAFLVREPTMAARITRAKKKISAARIPYRVPSPDQLDERVSVVLEVVHLIFTTGHTAPEGPRLARRDLVDSAISLARLLHLLMPTQADISALLALLLLIDARAQTRVSADGRLLLLSEQDRTRWDRQLISEGTGLLTDALRRGGPTRYAVEAAIAATHAEAPAWPDTDWAEITALYDVLRRLLAFPGGRAQPGGRDRPAGRPGGRPGRAGADPGRPVAGHLRLPQRGPGRLPAPARALARGGAGLRGGPRPDRQPGRTGLPHPASDRGPGSPGLIRRASR